MIIEIALGVTLAIISSYILIKSYKKIIAVLVVVIFFCAWLLLYSGVCALLFYCGKYIFTNFDKLAEMSMLLVAIFGGIIFLVLAYFTVKKMVVGIDSKWKIKVSEGDVGLIVFRICIFFTGVILLALELASSGMSGLIIVYSAFIVVGGVGGVLSIKEIYNSKP